MDELGFYVPSTVFQSFRDDGRINMKALCNEVQFYEQEESAMKKRD